MAEFIVTVQGGRRDAEYRVHEDAYDHTAAYAAQEALAIYSKHGHSAFPHNDAELIVTVKPLGRRVCGRLGVGCGDDTWDPACDLSEGHDGPCDWHPGYLARPAFEDRKEKEEGVGGSPSVSALPRSDGR